MARDADTREIEDEARAVARRNGHTLGRFSYNSRGASMRTARCSLCGEGVSYDETEPKRSLMLYYVARPCKRNPATAR